MGMQTAQSRVLLHRGVSMLSITSDRQINKEAFSKALGSQKMNLPEGVNEDRAAAAFWEYVALQGDESSIVWRRAYDLILLAPTSAALAQLKEAAAVMYVAGELATMPDFPSGPQYSQWSTAIRTAIRLGAIPREGFNAVDVSRGAIKSWNVPDYLVACSVARAYSARWMDKIADVHETIDHDRIAWLYNRIGTMKLVDLERLNNNMRAILAGDVTDKTRPAMIEVLERLFDPEGFKVLALPPSTDRAKRIVDEAKQTAEQIKEEHAPKARELANLQKQHEQALAKGDPVPDQLIEQIKTLEEEVRGMEEAFDTEIVKMRNHGAPKDDLPSLHERRASGKRDGFTAIEFRDDTARRFRTEFNAYQKLHRDAHATARTESDFLDTLIDLYRREIGELKDVTKGSDAYRIWQSLRGEIMARNAQPKEEKRVNA